MITFADKMFSRHVFFIGAIFILFVCLPVNLSTRSIHRPQDPLRPTITVNWQDSKKIYRLCNEHLEEWPLFKLFDLQFFNEHRLPAGPIRYRNDETQSVDGAVLSHLLEELVQEIKQQKIQYKNFIVLKRRNFNKKLFSGIIVLKFKDYPFVVKVFMENPYSFVSPFSKGWEPCFHFFMGGGVSRFLSGFTRIKNLYDINAEIAKSSYWSSIIDTPRKWFWTPTNNRWLQITGTNICTDGPRTIALPGIYCIVADAIEGERTFSLKLQDDRRLALSLCNYLEFRLDAHIDNFILERGTGKIVIVDTEHFSTMVGIKHKPSPVNSYASWFLYLCRKCTKDMFFRTKKQRGRTGTPFDMQQKEDVQVAQVA